MVICPKQGANDLHMVQADATVTTSSLSIQIGLTCLVPALPRLTWKRGC